MSDPASRPAVERFLAARAIERRFPGAAWWIEGPGDRQMSGALGSAVLEPETEPLGLDTPFDLASLTKPLCTALLLALLAEEGVLDLDAPAGEFLPGWRRSAFASASLLALATHTAGLPAWRPLYLECAGLEEYLAAIAAESPAVPAGKTLYSDLGYIALGAVLQRVAAMALDRLFAERVADPLGLRRTAFSLGAAEFADAAATERGNEYERALAGEAGRGRNWPTRLLRGEVHDRNAREIGGVAGHAGLFGPLEEVVTIAREILAPGRLPLGPRTRRLMLQPSTPGCGRTLGLGLAVASRAARGVLADAAPGHTGFTGTSLWLDPAAGTVFVLLTNRVHPSVPGRGFHPVRRGFHRLAQAALRGGGQTALPLEC